MTYNSNKFEIDFIHHSGRGVHAMYKVVIDGDETNYWGLINYERGSGWVAFARSFDAHWDKFHGRDRTKLMVKISAAIHDGIVVSPAATKVILKDKADAAAVVTRISEAAPEMFALLSEASRAWQHGNKIHPGSMFADRATAIVNAIKIPIEI